MAVYAGKIHSTQLLLRQQNIDIDVRNKDDETALFYAVRQANVPLIQLLLRNGINASLPDKYGDLAIEHSRNDACTEMFSNCHNSDDVDYCSKLPREILSRIYSYLSKNSQIKWVHISRVFKSMPFLGKNSPRSSGSGKHAPTKPYNRTTSDRDMDKIRGMSATPPMTGVPRPPSVTNETTAPSSSSSAVPITVFRSMTPTTINSIANTTSNSSFGGEKELLDVLGFEQSTTSTLLNRPSQVIGARKKSSSFTVINPSDE